MKIVDRLLGIHSHTEKTEGSPTTKRFHESLGTAVSLTLNLDPDVSTLLVNWQRLVKTGKRFTAWPQKHRKHYYYARMDDSLDNYPSSALLPYEIEIITDHDHFPQQVFCTSNPIATLDTQLRSDFLFVYPSDSQIDLTNFLARLGYKARWIDNQRFQIHYQPTGQVFIFNEPHVAVYRNEAVLMYHSVRIQGLPPQSTERSSQDYSRRRSLPSSL